MKRRLSALEPSTSLHQHHNHNHTLIENDSGERSAIDIPTKTLKRSASGPLPVIYSCDLPPTCNAQRPLLFHSSAALEAHYRTHHAFTCADALCSRIFPSQHFLNLHLDEVHDPLLRLKRLNYHHKIFRCFDPRCQRNFSCPKKRRLHLIDHHGYPPTFYFSLPNQGLNDLYKKYGPGVSLVRPDWRPKPTARGQRAGDGGGAGGEGTAGVGVAGRQEDMEGEEEEAGRLVHSASRAPASRAPRPPAPPIPDEHPIALDPHHALDAIVGSFKQLALIPRQIQFGKKAPARAFVPAHPPHRP